VLTYDGTGWIPSAPAAPFLEGIEYNINIQGNVIGLDSSILLDAATNTFTGNVSGSVFADDSTLLVDAVNSLHLGDANFTLLTASDFNVTSNTVNDEAIKFNFITNDQIGPGIRAEAARNSLENPQNLEPSDGILDIRGYGYYNGSYAINSVIRLKTAKREPFGTQTSGAIELSVTDGNGNFNFEKTFIMTAGGFGFGTGNSITSGFDFDVNGKSLFRDDLTVNGTVFGDLNGSIFIDDSTRILDGTSGQLYAANIDVVGETGNTPVDTVTVDSWLEISVNGATKYIPLYD